MKEKLILLFNESEKEYLSEGEDKKLSKQSLTKKIIV